MRPSVVPSRTGSISPDNSGATTSRRSSWGRSRRTFMACTECRRRQVKCTPSDTAGQACERCAKRKIKCEFMSIQEQKLLSTPDNDQSSAVTLHLPQYGGAVGGLSRQIPTGPILGDPADVRQGILGAPADHPLVRPTGLPIPATSLPPYRQPRQQVANPSAQTYHRPGTPSWNTQQYPQSTPTPTPRYPTPAGMTPIPQSTTPTPWYVTANSQSQPSSAGHYPPGHTHTQVRASPDVQWYRCPSLFMAFS